MFHLLAYNKERGDIMWTRSELKTRAKAAIKANYWKCLLVCIIFAVLSGNFLSVNVDYSTGQPFYTLDLGTASSYVKYSIITISAFTGIMLSILGLAFYLFVVNPLQVGKVRFFLENREAPTTLNALLYTFKQGDYLNIVKILFKRDLFIFLWSLLFIIPGIVKGLEYSQIEYILAENPSINSRRVFQITSEMTVGNRWDIFVLILSFIGWFLLGIFTCGIASVLVMPYMEATYAELYIALRDEYIDAGYAGFDEFPGFYRE